MSTRQIHVFISHAWAHSQHYDTLAGWIFNEPWSAGSASLDFRNYSVPRDNPVHNAPNTQTLIQAITLQIRMSHVIVIPSGMYATHSAWIQKEINAAKTSGKPILAVTPWAQQREADVVISNANMNVGWNKESVINAIWKLYYAQNP